VATFQADGIKPDGKQHTLGIVWAGASEHRGETTFTAPEQAAVASSDAAKPRAIWPYVLVAILCVAIVAGAVVFVKRKAGQAALESRGSSSYSLGLSDRGPMDSDDPPPAPRASFAEEPDRKPVGGSFDSDPLVPIVSPPAALPEIPVARAEIPRPRNTNQLKTQIVGIFQPLGNRIAALETIAGAHAGEIFDLPVFEFSIGRSPENHLPLGEDKTVSGRHASILFEDPILMVIDHGSTNGTRVNGEMLRGARRPLHEGDQIQIGQTVFRVRSAR